MDDERLIQRRESASAITKAEHFFRNSIAKCCPAQASPHQSQAQRQQVSAQDAEF